MYIFAIPYRNSLFSGEKYKRAFEIFQPYFRNFLTENSYNYKVLYVEQIQDGRLFNMGKLNNVGFDISVNYLNIQDNDIYAHHPVDQIPVDVNYNFSGDCNMIFDSRRDAPKVHMYKVSIYKLLNGYSNEYEGWGHEDSDMYERMRIKNIQPLHVQYNFQPLACNGTGITEGPGNYSPKYDDNWAILHNLQKTKNIYYSGLNTLEYELVSFKETNKNEYYSIVKIYDTITKNK